MQPAPKEILHRPRSQPLADLLQGGWIFTTTETIVEGLITNSSFFELPFSPLMAVEPEPNRIGAYALVFQNAAPQSESQR